MIIYRAVFVFGVFLLLSGCAAKTGFEPYLAHDDAMKSGVMSYQVTGVELVLNGHEATSRYPDADSLEAGFRRVLEEQIEARGLEGSDYALDVSVRWERRMIGPEGSPRDVFSSAGCWFEASIVKDDVVVASDEGDPLNAASTKYEHKNILNNLKRIGDSISRTGGPDSEQRELERCVKLLVERLPK